MGNSLGCVKGPKESIAVPEKAPVSPKKRVRFKRKWRGKKITTPEASHEEEPLEGTGVIKETETLMKLTASLGKEDRVGGVECLPSDILLREDSAPNSQVGDQGMIVQVKERFQGEIQTARLLLENESSVARGVWDSLEEGMTVIAHLLDNPAERNCEKSVSQLVEFPRTASCSSRAVLLPLQGEIAVERGGARLGFRCSTLPGTDYPTDTRNQDQLSEGWSVGGGTNSILGVPQTGSWNAKCSVPSSPLDQSGGPRHTEPARLGLVPLHGPKLPASQSDLSISGITMSILPSSSGYGSDGLHLHGIQPKDTEPEKSSTSFSEEETTLSVEASHNPSWGLEEISDIYISGESGDMSAKEKLLLWTQKVTAGYTGIKCTNFSSCWSDGKMFNALIHRYRPDLVDMERVQIQSNRENLEQAFEVAERLGVTRLLDAEDVDVPSPDEKSVITYVSSIYDAFPKVPEGGEGISATEVDSRWQEYQSRVDSLIPWIKQHTILMSDKSFPQNPVELKALYNQYIHFKETEILAKEREKGRIEELYKLLEVWIEFGRIKLPQGYHPNHVEEEWGKLIIEMLEREKSLRPAVERLELLLQIANKIQNGALNCEEKLTLAKNTLQADAAHLESGQPVQCESDVIMYIQECEGLIRQLQVDLQILRDENYYQLEELAFRVMRLQDELVTLRLECTNLYRKGHFTSLELVPPSTLTTTHLKAEPLTKATHSSTSWFRKPMTRAELVSISSSEDEGNLRFVYELLSWVEEMQMKLERAEWGNDLPSVELQLEAQQHIHTSVEELGSSVKEARLYEGKMSQNFHTSYVETLGKLETQYCKLKETSSFRMRHLQSLHKFVSRATAELIWLNEKEEEELAYDWSDNNPNISAKKNYFSELTMELEEKQDVFRSLQDTAELLSLENHPAKQTVEAYSAAVQSQLQWMRQLCLCVEQHVKENAAYFQFFSDARDLESFLRNLQDSIKRKYSCDHNTSLSRLEDLLQDSMAQDEKEQLIQSKSSVASLVGRSKTIVQLKPRSPDHVLKSTISVKAICDYRQIEITICKNDECVLEDNSQRTKWKVISPTGNEAMVPSVCFLIPPPNKDAIEMASRVEQSYQKVMALWHQLHVNTKSLISWNYLRKDLDLIQTWNLEKLRSLAPGECHQTMKNLQAHYEDFLQDSRDSALFSVADRLRLEEEVEACKTHFQHLMKSMENEDKEETAAKIYISELKNIRLRLEECEQRLVKRIQSPASSRTDRDARQDIALRIAEQEHTQEDLQQLRSDLDAVSMKCNSFLHQSPSSSSVPTLRSELNLLVEKMDHVHSLSTVYLNKLKTIDVIVRSIQDAELLVKGYEIKLSQEEAVPADLVALESHRSTLRHWLNDVKDKNSVFSVLDEEITKAKGVAEQLSRLTPERNLDLERYQEKGSQLQERWHRVIAQLETRQSELESIQEVLGDYRACHGTLIRWIEETTAQQEMMKPGQAEDSRVLSEQLSQQTDLFAEIERNQIKLDQCQKFSQQYSTIVKDYELQLMTYKAFVESQQKSPGKRRRMLSSSDAITQEFMDLRTRYTALVTLTTQHVKYISDALRRLEEEEKVVEEEKQEHVEKVKDLLGWVSTLARNTQEKITSSHTKESTDIEKAILEQQVLAEELTTKKEQVSEAIKTSQIFLAKHGHKLSEKEKEQISERLDALNKAYHDLCDGSSSQLQQLQSQLAQQTEQKDCRTVAGVIDLGTMEIFPIFRAMQKGLIDQDTGLVLLEFQVIMFGLVAPETSEKLSLEEGLARNLINPQMYQQLQELEDALSLISRLTESKGSLSVMEAIEKRIISERVGLKILEAHLATGGFSVSPSENCINLEEAFHQGLISTWLHSVLESHLRSSKNLIDPNTAEKISLLDLMQRCIVHQESRLKLLPVKQLAGGMVSLKSGRKVSVFRAVQEGLIDRQVTVRLLEAQLFAGGIVDPRTGHRLTVEEAVRHNLIDQDMACAIFIRQLQTGGIINTVTGHRMTIDEALTNDLVSAKIALVILESLWSFMGFLWPESGEILPITDALKQGIVSTELAHKILSNRQHIKALFLPATTEIWSWKKVIENGVLDKDLANNLKSICIPDVMPHMQLVDSSEQNKLSITPGAAVLPCSKSQSGDIASHDEKLLFQLMTHSYINVQNGQRLLLLDQELLETLSSVDEHKISPSEVFGVGDQKVDTPEELQESANGNITETFSDGLTLRPCEFQFSSQNEEYPNQEDYTEAKGRKTIVGGKCSSIENSEKDLFVEQKIINANIDTLKVTKKVNLELQRQLFGTKNEDQTEISTRENVSRELLIVPPKEAEGGPLEIDRDLSFETPEEEWRTPRNIFFRCQREQAKALKTKYTPSETGRPLLKSQSKNSQVQLEKSLGFKSELKWEDDMNIHSLEKEKVLNKSLLTKDDHKQSQEGHSIADSRMMMLEKTDTQDSSRAISLSCSSPSELLEEATLNMLSAQLLDGGILHEETGQKLLLNEAIAQGIMSSHTAVKLMGKLNMFRGFFDSQTCESLTTEEVINEGLMDEKLLHNVLMADKVISGVLDPRTHTLCSVKDAVTAGILDKETATRILEGQVVTGGIVDLKRGKKVSVTLASNLDLVDSADQTELINLEKASKGKESEKLVREKLIGLQMETTGLMDPNSKAPLTVVQSIDQGLLKKEEAICLLTKQVVDGGIIHHTSGMRLSVDNAFKQGLIDEDLTKQLKNVENVNLHHFFHPETKESVSLHEAIKLNLTTPDLKREIQEGQAFSENLGDLISGQRLTVAEGNKGGLLTNKAVLSSVMMHGVVDPENYRIVPYSELIKKCKIDIESGQRYLEVIPFSDIKDGVSDKVIPLSEAVQLGKVDFVSTLKVLEAQANTGGIIDTATGERLTLALAMEQKLVDKNMARIIASNQMLNGGIVDIFNDKRVTLKEAVEKRFISPELATLIQIDTFKSSDHQAHMEKQNQIEVCELQTEYLRKKILISYNQTAKMSCDKGESKSALQIESQFARGKDKVRDSDGKQIKESKEISLEQLEDKDHDKWGASADAKGSASVLSPSNLKGKSLDQVSVPHPHSAVSDFRLKEVARNNLGENTNVEHEKGVTHIETVTHLKQPNSGLDEAEAKENQREMIWEVQESNCEASDRLLSEQPLNIRVTSEREKREMIVEESVRPCRPAVLSEEKLDQEMTRSEREKESDRDTGFSVTCKTEDSSSQVTPKGISVRNQDTLTFFSSAQVSEEEVKNVNLCLTLKPGEILHQELTSGAQSHPFSFMTPRPEGFHCQVSVIKAQVTDTPQISNTNKTTQGASSQETNYYQDSCVTSKTTEIKDLIFPSKECKETSYQEVPFVSRRVLKFEEIIVSKVDPEEVSYLESSDRKDLHHKNSKGDHEHCGTLKSKMATTQETNGEKFLEMTNPIFTDPEAGSPEGIVIQGGPTVLVTLLPEKLPKEVSQKENTGQQDSIISSTTLETSEETTLSLPSCSTVKVDMIPQEKLREGLGSKPTSFMGMLRGKGSEGVNPEPLRATQNVFNRQLCLEHDEKLVSYLSLLRDIEMRTKQIQPLELNLVELQDLLCQAQVEDKKLKDATERYTVLHSKCTRLGSYLNMLLGQYQQFQSSADSLKAWLQTCEASVEKLLSDTIASDPGVLQQQLATTKQLQEELAEHQVPVEKLQKVAHDLMEIEGEPSLDPKHVQETTDSILSHFQSLSCSLAERSALLQKAIAQSQSVQESLESLLQSIREVEQNLEGEQVASLSSGVIQEALANNMKLKQDIARQKSSLEATREMVTQFMETADNITAAVLQGKLVEASQHFEQLQLHQQEKESTLKKLLPQAEMFEQLSNKLQQFMENKSRMLASGNQPDQDIAHFSQQIQELTLEMTDQQENLDTLEHLVTALGSCGFALDLSQHQGRVQNLKRDFAELQKTVQEREKDASSCQEQLDEFRKLIRTFQKWLKETEGSIPSAETFMSAKELEKLIEHLKGILIDWASKGTLVEEINCKGTSLENLIMEITAPDSQAKTGSILPSVGSSVGSVNGYHTCKDLTEIQCDLSDVNLKYEKLGGVLRERQESLQAVLSRMEEVQKEARSVLQWLESKEEVLKAMDASLSPTKTETVKAQAESNKAFLAELEQNSPKVQEVKQALAELLMTYPNSQEAENWKKIEEELNSRWERATEVTVTRQKQLEESASHLACFQAAESQLRPWLMEKELMMGVLGPLSIDPNMLNAQKQQVQFMLKEFETRKQQHEQLNEAAQGILTGPGDVSPSTSQVQKELQSINQKWVELTDKLNSRSSQIDQAIVKSTQYQELLQDLSEKVKAVGQRLSGQSAISTQPEAVKQQLEETSEIRSDLEQLDNEIKEAQTLCDELSVLIGEQYLKDELKKRLETVTLPLQGLEDLAADRMNRLQSALASTQQFQQMFDELKTWLDDKQSQQAKSCPISAKLEQLQSQLQENEEFQKSLNQHSGSYEVIVAEGESLLLSVPPGEEKRTLQNQLVELKSHWEELSKKTADRQSRLKDCMQKAQKYQWHVEDLVPWIEDCKAKMSELQVTLDPVQLESSLLRAKAMLSEVEKRRSLLEILNSAADILINFSETDEDGIRDEKAEINQNMDAITEELQAKTGLLEEMTQRLKEFQESFKNIERKVEGAKHQLEIFDALGSQACSNKNLEKLRAQQEVLQALEPQVDYLRNFTQGLVEDAPNGSDVSQLLHQAEVTQQEFLEVKQRVNSGCMTMENKLEGIGQFHCRVREMFSQLADLDDELDGMGAIGRDTDSLQSQIEDVRLFLNKIQSLKFDIEASEAECRQMLEEEGTLDLLGLKRELEALNKQCGKLTERGKARQEQLELTLGRVEDFYRKLKVLNDATTAAEEGEALQWIVGTEVDVINQQLADFKMFQKEQVDPLQMKLQQVNGLGQGLIQSAGKNCDVQGLEHDMEEINARWNTLNKKVAQRIAQLQEALLHCGKFQDALEPLLSWLADTEELIANQKPPSAEYKVVKAQIQEQKLLQRLLDDRKATVDMLQAEGGRIAQSAEVADREKITGQLRSLESRWTELLSKAAARQNQLEDILVLAKQFHETAEPISDFLSVTEKKLANSEPVGTQTAKIQQQIIRHKALEEDIENHATDVHQAVKIGQSLSSLTCPAEQGVLSEKLDSLQAQYSEIQDWCCRKAALLEQALSNARLFGEDEVEVLNWLAEVEDKLSSVFVKDYRQDVLQKQHADHLISKPEHRAWQARILI
ncbi:microtubule-actin cross-linking factor 1 isoform X31 [Marmota marmota marmota]|uniref:microtubule-actin cross-linking factor 1 isoform X31 n=1 Tax=Marmota marmota marmota TaxID=9994 RepID=UPI002093E734|nr:microtubule-actin cross-linking factor 1 isoform X31 [Marmota marmota marmota]